MASKLAEAFSKASHCSCLDDLFQDQDLFQDHFLDLLLEAAEGATDSAFLARVMSSLPSSLAAFMTTARSVSVDLILEGLGL